MYGVAKVPSECMNAFLASPWSPRITSIPTVNVPTCILPRGRSGISKNRNAQAASHFGLPGIWHQTNEIDDG
jgi:hypothetical protein